MTKQKKDKICIQKTKKGVTIWVNGLWVLDASLFNEDMQFTIDNKRMKLTNVDFNQNVLFEYKKMKE